jgi:hypothetical protein
MIGLEDLMAAQEIEFISAGTDREVAEQGHQCLEVESQKLRSACNGEFLSTLHYVSVLSSRLVTNPLFLYRVAHMGTLGSREGGHELKGARDGHLAGRADLL